jgi:hypothetical protein
MAGPEIRESMTVAGQAERARAARAFVVGVLGPGHPCGNDAAMLVSELFSISVRHSRSGAAGGTVTVAVSAGHVYRFKIVVRRLTCRRLCGKLCIDGGQRLTRIPAKDTAAPTGGVRGAGRLEMYVLHGIPLTSDTAVN